MFFSTPAEEKYARLQKTGLTVLSPLMGLPSSTGGKTRHSAIASQEVAACSRTVLLKPAMRKEERMPQADSQTNLGCHSYIHGQSSYNFSFSSTDHN